ncbi:hypothetical protein E4T56_gene3751 [Termitomyces sp. T112]|nr:hypothetical protein E4T56_gene3751 [Termitomyces sp. T112]
MSLLFIASVFAFYATGAAAGASLTPPPDTVIPSSSTAGSTTTTNGSLSVTPTSSAQFPSLSGFSDCVTNCLQLAVADTNCTSIIDVNCYCKTSRFTRSLVNCTESSCQQEVGTAESLAQQFCFIGNASASLSFPPTTSIPSSSATKPSSSLTSSSLALSTPTNPSGTTSGDITPSASTAGNTVATSNAAASAFLAVGSTSVVSSQFLGLCLTFLGVLIGAALVE